MRSQTWRIVGLVLSGAIFVIAFVIPAVVLMARLLREGVAPTDGFTISVRQWRLLADSLMLALGGLAFRCCSRCPERLYGDRRDAGSCRAV